MSSSLPMFQTTRRRLALWYTTVTAILLLLFATGFYLYVRGTLIERIDDTLNHVVEVVRRSLVIEPINPHVEGGALRVNMAASFRDNTATDEDDHIDLEWFSPTGELLWSTLTDVLHVPLTFEDSGRTVHLSQDQELRQITQRVEIGRQVLGYLRVSHPWFEVTKPSRQLFVDLILGTGVTIAVVGAIGWFLSGLAMEPVRESYQRLKQFTADASHELRSPIAVIQTNVQVALADPDPDIEMQRYHLRVVERLTRRLGRLVDNLLFLARQDSGIVQTHWTMVDLNLVLQEVLEEQQTLADAKTIEIRLNRAEAGLKRAPATAAIAPPGSPAESVAPIVDAAIAGTTLQADPDQLVRLFTNLVGNAVQYTPAGGMVCVELQRIGRPGNVSLQVTIRDTGMGMSEEALLHVFDRFYRIDPARSQTTTTGSGLGLAIARAIVENHHGVIRIDSTLNQGTTVTVTLPVGYTDSQLSKTHHQTPYA